MDIQAALAPVRDRLMLENLVLLYENTREVAFRTGGNLDQADRNLAFSRQELADFVKENS